MKQFKNSLSVTGEKHHIDTFIKDLESMGYKNTGSRSSEDNVLHTGWNAKWDEIGFAKIGYVGFDEVGGRKRVSLKLPVDWSKALELAKEQEEIKEEKEFKENDWVIWSGSNPAIGRIDRRDGYNWGNGDICYILKEYAGSGKYTSCSHKHLRKATPEEIEKHLIGEAEKKGFVKGAKTDSGIIESLSMYKNLGPADRSNRTHKYAAIHGENFIVATGEWFCLPIEELKLLPSTPSIGIGGKPVEFHENYVRIFDKPIPKERFSEIHEVFEPLLIHGINIQGVLVKKCNGDEVLITPKQIETISNHFTK
jgi:hypothetical protein